jgi:hypothetical protein
LHTHLNPLLQTAARNTNARTIKKHGIILEEKPQVIWVPPPSAHPTTSCVIEVGAPEQELDEDQLDMFLNAPLQTVFELEAPFGTHILIIGPEKPEKTPLHEAATNSILKE